MSGRCAGRRLAVPRGLGPVISAIASRQQNSVERTGDAAELSPAAGAAAQAQNADAAYTGRNGSVVGRRRMVFWRIDKAGTIKLLVEIWPDEAAGGKRIG